MERIETSIPGVQLISPASFLDERGQFIKVFHSGEFAQLGLRVDFKESYYTRSRKNVIRGMHFQTPPHDHEKLVYVVEGAIQDVVLDLRAGSPNYGHHIAVELSAENRKMLYLPKGVAHGFAALTDNAVVTYLVTTIHAPQHDRGVRYDSFGHDWKIAAPVLSERDRKFPKLSEWNSPFIYTN